MPSGSRRRRSLLRDSGSRTMTATSATATMGTLMRNTEPHQKLVSSQPPSMGPTGKPSMLADMSTATALGRSASLNSTGSTPMAMGSTTAAPRPSSARAAMSAPAEGA